MTEILQIGKLLPTLDVETSVGKSTAVQDNLGPNQTLIYFLHGTWCPKCVGQFHLLQRYLPRISETGADLIVITGEDTDTLSAFLQSTHPALEYTVLADPKHSASRALKAGDDTMTIVVDDQGGVRWFKRWPEHQDEPSYSELIQVLSDVSSAEKAG